MKRIWQRQFGVLDLGGFVVKESTIAILPGKDTPESVLGLRSAKERDSWLR